MKRLLAWAGNALSRLIETKGEWLFVPAGAMLLYAFGRWVKWLAVAEFPGLDLRDRIVGAREMALGLNPYANATNPAGGWPAAALIDPRSEGWGIAANTAPPTMLDLYRLFMQGDWSIIRWFWGSLEWAAFLALSTGLIASARRRQHQGFIALILASSMAMSTPWANHVQLGQSYVFIAGLIGCDVLLLWHGRRSLAGWCSGLALALRPSLLLLVPVFWLGGRRPIAVKAGSLGLALLLASYAWQSEAWAQYSSHIDRFVQWHDRKAYSDTALFTAASVAAAADGYPIKLERSKADIEVKHKPQSPLAEVMRLIAETLGWTDWRLRSAFVGAVVAGFALFVAWRCRRPGTPEALAILVAWVLVLADETAPIRNDYLDIFFLPGIGTAALFAIRHRSWLVQAGLIAFAIVFFGPLTRAIPGFYDVGADLYHLIMALSTYQALHRTGGSNQVDPAIDRQGEAGNMA